MPHTPAESEDAGEHLTRLARLAARVFRAPMAVISYQAGDGPRPCAWTGLGADVGEVEVCALARKFTDFALVPDVSASLVLRSEPAARELGIRAFAAAPVLVQGRAVGSLCVMDTEARTWLPADASALRDLATTVAREMQRLTLAGEVARLAAALQESRQRYLRVTQNAPIAILVLDTEGRIAEANPAAERILTACADPLVGRPLAECVAPEARERVAAEVRLWLGGQSGRPPFEVEIVQASGEHRRLEMRSEPLREGERVVGVHVVVRDVTRQRIREAQFLRAERMAGIGAMLTGVAHELNNPLTSIKSFAELMLLDDRPEEDREALEIILKESRRASRIVSDLRAVGRQTQEVTRGTDEVQLNEVMEHLLMIRRYSLDLHAIRVEEELAPGLPPIRADRARLEQAISHLLVNAEQALARHPGERRLRVRTHTSSMGVALRVSDTGPGIPPADLERVFDAFWTTRTPADGAGLGLSLVHAIVTEHGGRIRVENRPGGGAEFIIEFPPAEEAAIRVDESDVSPARTALRLLVVDDEAPIRYSVLRYMERRGHRVDEAAEGGEALRLLESTGNEGGYDVIVADLRMPGLDGEQLFHRLKERRDGSEQRLIFITGDVHSDDMAEFLRTAGVPVVCKPFELAEVAQVIEGHAGTLGL